MTLDKILDMSQLYPSNVYSAIVLEVYNIHVHYI